MLAIAISAPSRAQLELPPEGREIDPLAFAAKVRRRGDDPILEALADPRELGRAARKRAIRAAPHLHEPAAALPILAEIAASREPFDALAAMHAAFTIVRALPGDAVERFELDQAPLLATADAFARLAEDASAHPRIRAMATVTAAELRDLVR